MTLAAGVKLGPYEILGALGAGGMGEVYRARDERLGRDVAIKVVPEAVSADPKRLLRLEREARMMASVSHPNVGAIYGIEDSSPTKALVLELVEGPTLEDRMGSGAIPVAEALRIAGQIAEALEAAHEKGVVHRDLKPGNIKVDGEDRVKVLDFGLAKALDPAATSISSSPDTTQSPTLSLETRDGMILGTAPYMAPEQARGRSTDRRADIWAFGVVLHEMLTGKRLFAGETVSDILAAVLRNDISFADLPPATPATIRGLLRRCLDRDSRTRLRDIGEARIVIESALAGRESGAPAPPAETLALAGERRRRSAAVAALVAVAAIAVAAFLLGRSSRRASTAPEIALELQYTLPRGERAAVGPFAPSFAISPDGTRLVYTVVSATTTRLRQHRMEARDSTEIPGTEGAAYPFFSPDGKWIAFFNSAGLEKVAASGGSPLMVAAGATVFGGAVWADDGSIFFVPQINTPVSRVSSDGGPVRPVTRFEPGDQNHRWPEALPGGKAILFTVGSGTEWDSAKIVGENLATGERKLLIDGGTRPRYIPGGYLVYARGNSLNAVSFDAQNLRVTGTPVEVARNVWLDLTGLSHFDVSRTGTLVSISPETAGARVDLSWIDRSGRAEPLNVDPVENFVGGGPSPDGRRAVLRLGNSIGILDFDRLSLRRLTLSDRTAWALWSADGTRILFGMEKERSYRIFSKAADDSGTAELLFPSDTVEYPAAVFRDGRRLLVLRAYPNGENAIVVRSTDPRDRNAETVLVRSRFVSGDVPVSPTSEAAISPDGRWVAYTSFASGRQEVLVRPSSGEDREWQISANGGGGALWSPSGREIVYGSGTRLMSATVHADGDFSSEVPRVLFDRPDVRIADFAPGGERFFGTVDPNYRTESRIDVTTSWFATIRRKVQESAAP